jgi:hypothetical protein
MRTKTSDKSKELTSVLHIHFKENSLYLARVKFIAQFIMALCKVQTVTFEKLACGFDTTSKVESSLRHIQRFISSFTLESDMIAKLIFNLFPENKKVRVVLSM